jgi:hypothetical protein
MQTRYYEKLLALEKKSIFLLREAYKLNPQVKDTGLSLDTLEFEDEETAKVFKTLSFLHVSDQTYRPANNQIFSDQHETA